MDEEDSGLLLNVSAVGSFTHHAKQRLSKKERIKQRRNERRERERQTVSPGEDRNLEEREPPKKRKAFDDQSQSSNKKIRPNIENSSVIENHEPSPRRGRPASLFTNNPSKPQIQSIHVEPIKELVFTGKNFSELGLHPHMVSNLETRLAVKEMTRIQRKAIPSILQGSDTLVKSQTGSGKTLTYAIPLVEKLQALRPRVERADGPYALIVVPTRELALQTLSTVQQLVYPFTWVVPGCIMGGEKKKSEKARIRRGINILIATPGRLLDHIQHTESLSLCAVQWLIIDEADRLLEMGFQREVSQIIDALNEKNHSSRQTVLLSATLTQGVETLAGMSMKQPVVVDATYDDASQSQLVSKNKSKQHAHTDGQPSTKTDIKTGGEKSNPETEQFSMPEKLRHHYMVVPLKLRLVTLAAFLLWKCKLSSKRSKVLVFFATQDAVEFHHSLFLSTLCNHDNDGEQELEILKLHGDMAQKERSDVFRDFTAAESGVLFCTDVAARGLDLPLVRWIVQYNPPGSTTDYVHRVGRTARIGSHGNGLLFLTPAEVGFVEVLSQSKVRLEETSMDDILNTLLVEASHIYDNQPKGRQPHTMKEAAASLQSQFEGYVQGSKEGRSLARKAYQSCVRAYAAFPVSLKHIFHVKSLHLGHLATSFCLQEAPSKIGNVVGKFGRMDADKLKKKRENALRKPKLSAVSEYDSGLTKASRKMSMKKTRKKTGKTKNSRK